MLKSERSGYTPYLPGSWQVHATDSERLRTLDPFRQLQHGAASEQSCLDKLTDIGAQHFSVDICCISLVLEDTQHFIGCTGLPVRETSRDVSFCSQGLLSDGAELFCVPDASSDARFCDNPCVLGAPHIRFYAGAPLVHPQTGHRLGMLCILSDKPRQLQPAEALQLREAASVVMAYLELLVSPSSAMGASLGASLDATLVRFTAACACAAPVLDEEQPLVSPRHPPQPLTRVERVGNVVSCLGWNVAGVPAARLVASLLDACKHLGAHRPPSSTDQLNFIAERVGQDAIMVGISLYPSRVPGVHDVLIRRLRGNTFTYHSFLHELQAQLQARLVELPAGQLVLHTYAGA